MPILQQIFVSHWGRISPYLHIYYHGLDTVSSDKRFTIHSGMLDALKRKDQQETCRFLKQDIEESFQPVLSTFL